MSSKLAAITTVAAAALAAGVVAQKCRGRWCKTWGAFTATGLHVGYCDECVADAKNKDAKRQTTHRVKVHAKAV